MVAISPPNPKPWRHSSFPTSRTENTRPKIVNTLNNNNNDVTKRSSAGKIKREALTKEGRTKLNTYSDSDFYAYPRFVTHVDDGFISTLTNLYRQRLSPGSEILDLMSSWVSHLPQEVVHKRVVGHGLNAQELAKNPQLDYFIVKDLNQDQRLEFEDCSFDAVVCTVSVQYLQQPEKVNMANKQPITGKMPFMVGQTPAENMPLMSTQEQPSAANVQQQQQQQQPPGYRRMDLVQPGVNPMIQDDRFKLSGSNNLLELLQSIHIPGFGEFMMDVNPVIHIVEDIFKLAVPNSYLESHAPIETFDDQTFESDFAGTLGQLCFVDRISCEITRTSSGGTVGDAHLTTISILNMIASHSWAAKVVLALSTFAVTYGEFWLIAQSYTTNQLAKAVAILKQLPEIFEYAQKLKPQLDAIKSLTTTMIDISKCIVEFSDLPENEIRSSADAHIPVAVYWTIRSILACAAQLTGLTLLGRQHIVSPTEAWELSSLAHKLSNIHSHLLNLLLEYHKYMDEKNHLETLSNLKNLCKTTHIDNMSILRPLIYQKDDLPPLVDGATRTRVNLDVLKRKMVLLLISDLDISQEEVAILEQLYSEARQQQHTRRESHVYEVVWLPIVDPAMPWTESKQKQFEALQSVMSWYTVHHPSLINRTVIQFIKEEWQFVKKPILVVIDSQGKVVSPNALHMMWIWGSAAYPFSTTVEEELWEREKNWRLELLVDGIDPMILSWMAEGRYICLYGGDDIEWIRKFTTTANAVAKAAGINLGMVYVGKSKPKERVRRNNVTISMEKLSHNWQDLTSMWFFWVRLESMWYSKAQLGRTVENDHIMQEIMAMLSYDSSEGGWAVFARGSANEMTRAKGGTFLTCLQEYNVWKEHVQPKGFVPAMRDHLMELHTPQHCNMLVLPGTAGKIPERIICSECGRVMEQFLMYRCCDE